MLVLAVWGSVLAGAFGSLVGPAVLLVLYGIYFGVLGRDLAEVCAERMASTMGVCFDQNKISLSLVLPFASSINSIYIVIIRIINNFIASIRRAVDCQHVIWNATFALFVLVVLTLTTRDFSVKLTNSIATIST
jgi:hypothetical protein